MSQGGACWAPTPRPGLSPAALTPGAQETAKVVWYSHLFKNFPQLIGIHTVKGFGIVNKAEIDVSILKQDGTLLLFP